jgi:xanthine dehydrogenase accessory factor
LRQRGLEDRQLERLRGPVGLDLGADTPEEIAVAMGAELLRDVRAATGVSLSELHALLPQS